MTVAAMAILTLGMLSLPAVGEEGAPHADRAAPAHLEDLKLSTPLTATATAFGKLDPALVGAVGPVTVSIQLSEAPVAEANAQGRNAAQQRAQGNRVAAQQNTFLQDVSSIDAGAVSHGSVSKAFNAVFVEVDASVLEELAADPRVERIALIVDYELDLLETVPYVGASAVQGQGFDGSGIKVAVLDTGIDYTHANLGGSGDLADFAAATADPNVVVPELFPTAKVVGGFDFVGSVWPFGALDPNPNPIDEATAGHGSHVADIIGGVNGVAPGVELYAVKVCSAVAPNCSGIALMQAMDFALDPEGLGHTNNPVDIINMSLGALYGQAFDNSLAQAVENATAIGVLTVASAGNSADKPYVTGTPAAAPTALSVAQTQVPSAVLQLIEVGELPGIPAVFQPWSVPLPGVLSGPVQYGDGAGGNLLGCNPFTAGSLDGLIVLVDRGACNFTLKIKNIGDAGGIVGIIGLVAPGAPFAGGDGGDAPITIPGYMISQADANAIKGALPADGTVDPDNGIPLVGQMVGSSSRGPTMQGNLIKPEIGAPGGSVSAIAGTGSGEGPFGGTSGAAPMVSGAAALLMEAYPSRSPLEIKAVLINTGDTDIDVDPFSGLAPITMIGGGELRVDRALATAAAAWDANAPSAALSFGFVDASTNNAVLHKTVTVRNFSNQTIRYRITKEFRFANDVANGAVQVSTPNTVSVPANQTASFVVTMRIDGTKLRPWTLNSGAQGANGPRLTLFEYDGYLRLTQMGNPANSIHLPWQVLPRSSGDVRLQEIGTTYDFSDHPVTRVRNHGVGTTRVEAYSLIGVSEDGGRGGPGEGMPNPNFRSIGYATFPVPAGFCSGNASFVMAFAVNTWERTTHANAPADFRFFLDVDQDGASDFLVINRDLTLNTLGDGRNVTWVINLATNTASAFFFTDHETNSTNTVLFICGEQIGMNAANFFQPIDVTAQAFDLYFQGQVTDILSGITISPLGEQYLGVFDVSDDFDGSVLHVGATVLSLNESANLVVLDFGPGTNNTETGLLLLYRRGGPDGNEAAIVVIDD